MATFKYMVRKDKMRADGTWNVVIRMTHERTVRYLPTSMYVKKADLTSAFKIKNYKVIDRCEDIISSYRKKCMDLDLDVVSISIDKVAEYLTRKEDGSSPSFTDFAEKWIEEKDIKGKKNYKSALKAFQRFMGRDGIRCMDVTQKTLTAFEESLKDKERARSLYTGAIVRMFNDARLFFNDEDNGITVIRHSLDRYHAPKQNVAKKRALTLEQIRKIFALPYDGLKPRGRQSRHDLALDCFRLSFALMGMNAVDMFQACEMDGSAIIYNRAKTKDRRSDGAEMHVTIQPHIMALARKYLDKDGHVFNFHRRFGSATDFGRALNIGLKEIGREIGVEGLQFYAARHSMATIAVNDVGISKYVVNDMLCHVDASLRITELYIRKDFGAINEANKRLLDYVLGDMQKEIPTIPHKA